MKHRAVVLGLVVMLACCTARLSAHESFRFTGKITKWDRPTMVVATRESGTVAIKVLSDFATITYKGKPSTVDEVKVGREVVVDGWGDSITDVEALTLNIDPPKDSPKK